MRIDVDTNGPNDGGEGSPTGHPIGSKSGVERDLVRAENSDRRSFPSDTNLTNSAASRNEDRSVALTVPHANAGSGSPFIAANLGVCRRLVMWFVELVLTTRKRFSRS